MEDKWLNIISVLKNRLQEIDEKKPFSKPAIEILIKEIKSAAEKKILTDSSVAQYFISNQDSLESLVSLKENDKETLLKKLSTRGTDVKRFTIDQRTLKNIILNSKFSTNTRVRNLLSIYSNDCLFENQLINNRVNDITNSNLSSSPIKTKVELLQQFYNTHWWVYYFHYDENLKKGKIGKAYIIIKNNSEVFLHNVPDETTSHFTGKFEIESTFQHIYFELASSKFNEKKLRITLFRGVGKVFPIMLGVYTNIYSNNSMVAGSIVFQKIDKPMESALKAKEYNFEDINDNIVPPYIHLFLQDRSKNFIKTTSNILTLNHLEQWYKEKHENKK